MSITPTTPSATTTVKGKVKLAGDLGGTADLPTVVGMKESGGQDMAIGAVADGQFLKRSGTGLIGAAPSADSGTMATMMSIALIM